MSGAIPLLSLYALAAWTRTVLHLRSKGNADAVVLGGETAHKSSARKYTEREVQATRFFSVDPAEGLQKAWNINYQQSIEVMTGVFIQGTTRLPK
jgi:hypothetical protein